MANETVLFKRGDSATITSTPVTDGQILFDTSGNGKMYLDNGTDRLEMGGAITVDASLSKTSTNAIQNKAVTGNILNSFAEVSAATQQNTIAGALALKEGLTNENNESFNFGYLNGVRGFFTNPSRADDSFIPFSNAELHQIDWTSSGGATITKTLEVEPKFLIYWFNINQSVEVYDVKNKKTIVNTTSTNHFPSINGNTVTVYCDHGGSATDHLAYI